MAMVADGSSIKDSSVVYDIDSTRSYIATTYEERSVHGQYTMHLYETRNNYYLR